jgi:hypothetical protein
MADRRRSVIAASLFGLGAVTGCQDDVGAAVDITDMRVSRDPQKRVVVDVDLVAREALGRNVGVYCTEVTFAGQDTPHDECKADLDDGDKKTLRVVSDGDVPEGGDVSVRVRLGAVDVRRSLAAPHH